MYFENPKFNWLKNKIYVNVYRTQVIKKKSLKIASRPNYATHPLIGTRKKYVKEEAEAEE